MRTVRPREPIGRYAWLLASFWAGVAFAQTPVTTLEFGGAALKSERSGAAGTERRLEFSGPKGLKTIAWEEQRDNPCFIEVHGRNLDNMGLDQTVSRHECGSTDVSHPEVVGYPQDESLVYISGLRVCMDRGGDRIKGIQVRGRVPSSQGVLSDAPREPKYERPNCHDWREWVECPADHIASGLVAEFESGNEPRSITGLRLLCSRVDAKTTTAFVPRLTGETKVLDKLSGNGGEAVDIIPGAGAYGLDNIHWAERRDRPCTVTVEGRDLGERNKRADRVVNKCGKDDVEGKYNLASASMKYQNENRFITGLRVCINNDRVKGVEVEGKVPVSSDDPDPPPSTVENDTGWQLNCALAAAAHAFNGDWVRCSKGQMAVGLRAYFERGDEPRSILGMTLICRAYE
jgi:hypothetical protein